jgi:disulfide bond formation protein DsbB
MPKTGTHQAGAPIGPWLLLLGAWGIALFATLAAIFIGEVMGQAPCLLCWYQRAFMFPLAVILAVAAYRSDMAAWHYALPIAAIGWLFAAYHLLIYAELLPKSVEPCTQGGPSCSDAAMTILGTVPIPALSLGAFTAIVLVLLLIRRESTHE